MKKKNYYTGIIAALLIASPIAGAGNKYPASDFKPTVVYQDADYKSNQSAGSGSSQSKSSADPNYPAANFEPKVVYKDNNYKPSKSSDLARSSSQASTSEGGESESDYSLGLIVLVLAGLLFFFNKKGLTPAAQGGKKGPSRRTSGATGVARYLQDMEGAALSGVARYLEKQNLGAAATGVAKYMAKQTVSAKDNATGQLSGVDKYLRDKG